jgi:hypothetical protein
MGTGAQAGACGPRLEKTAINMAAKARPKMITARPKMRRLRLGSGVCIRAD